MERSSVKIHPSNQPVKLSPRHEERKGGQVSGLHRSPTKQRSLVSPPEPLWKPKAQVGAQTAVVRANAQGDSPITKKPSTLRQLLQQMGRKLFPRPMSVYTSTCELVNHYNQRVAERDAAPVSAQDMGKRIDARLGQVQSIIRYAVNKDAGSNARRLTDLVNGLNKEQALLEDIKTGLLPAAQAQGITVNLSLQELIDLRNSGISQASILNGMRFGLDARGILLVVCSYEKLGIPFNAQTFAQAFTDVSVVVDSKKLLGSGKMNTVYRLDYTLPDGRVAQMVFKPAATDELADAAIGTGIPEDKPNYAGRTVATSVMAGLIGESARQVIPYTKMAIHENRVGTVMSFVPGQIPRVGSAKLTVDADLAQWLAKHPAALTEYARSKGFANALIDTSTGEVTLLPHERILGQRWDTSISQELDYGDPVIRRDLTRVQWLDALGGQVDRNSGNYVVQLDEQGRPEAVRAIDNDLSCGVQSKVLTRKELQDKLTTEVRFYRGGVPTLPKVIDVELKDDLLACDPEHLRAALSPYLSSEEVEARVEALERIQFMLGPDSPEPVHVIGALGEWASDETAELLGMSDLDQVATQEQIDAATQAGYVARDDLIQKNQRLVRKLAFEEVDLEKLLASGQLPGVAHQKVSARLGDLKGQLKGEAATPVFDPGQMTRDLHILRAQAT